MALDNPKYQKMLDNLIKICTKNLKVVDETLIKPIKFMILKDYLFENYRATFAIKMHLSGKTKL